MFNKKLYRSEKDKKIAGICGGIGEYTGVDSTIIRLAWMISVFLTGGGMLLAYIIAIFIIPKKSEVEMIKPEDYLKEK